MGKVNFTADRIATFKCEPSKKQSLYWDAKTPGLGLRVTANGVKSFIFESRLHGKTLRITIGDIRTWQIGKAQSQATELKSLTDRGIDPRQQRMDLRDQAEAAQAEEQRRVLTLGDAWPVYLEARKEHWSAGHYGDHMQAASLGGMSKKRGKGLTVAGPLAGLMSTPMGELTSEKIAGWLKTESKQRPTAAALSYRLLRAFISWSADVPAYRNIIPAGAASSRLVRNAVPRSQSREGDSLQREQLTQWFDAVRRLSNPVVSAYLQALLLTGARRREMSGLRWEDVDFQWRSLTIRDKTESKGGENGTRTIPLTPYLAGLLQMLPRRNQWVFSSPTSADGNLTEARDAHSRALTAAGLPHLSIHGLRRSFSTLCEWVEVPAGISAQIMGHRPSALAEKHYKRRPLDMLRAWHDKIEAWTLAQAQVQFLPAAESGLRIVIPA